MPENKFIIFQDSVGGLGGSSVDVIWCQLGWKVQGGLAHLSGMLSGRRLDASCPPSSSRLDQLLYMAVSGQRTKVVKVEISEYLVRLI